MFGTGSKCPGRGMSQRQAAKDRGSGLFADTAAASSGRQGDARAVGARGCDASIHPNQSLERRRRLGGNGPGQND